MKNQIKIRKLTLIINRQIPRIVAQLPVFPQRNAGKDNGVENDAACERAHGAMVERDIAAG